MKKIDLEIQDYLDDNLSGDERDKFNRRLQTDPELRNRLIEYQNVYSVLKSDPGIVLSPKFTSRVLKKTQIDSLGSLHFELWHIFIALFLIIVGINVTFYYVDMKTLVNDMKFSPGLNLNLSTGILNNIGTFISNLDINFILPVLGIIIIAVLGLLDHFIFSGRHRTASFYR